MKTVKGNVLDNLSELVKRAINEYNQSLEEDPEMTDTDTFMFILEDIGNEVGMNEQEFIEYSEEAYKQANF